MENRGILDVSGIGCCEARDAGGFGSARTRRIWMTGAKNGNGYLEARMDVLLEVRMMHYFTDSTSLKKIPGPSQGYENSMAY